MTMMREESPLSAVAMVLNMHAKKRHTIIERSPFALKLKYGQAGAQEEFDTLLESSQCRGGERYMEWKRLWVDNLDDALDKENECLERSRKST